MSTTRPVGTRTLFWPLHQGLARHQFRPCPRQLLVLAVATWTHRCRARQLAYLDHVAIRRWRRRSSAPFRPPAPACATATSSTATRLASAPSGVPPSPLPLQKTPRFLPRASSVEAGCASPDIVSTALAKRHPPNPAKQDPAPPPACRIPR